MIARAKRQPVTTPPAASPMTQPAEAPPMLHGVFEPPSGMVARALRANWALIVLIALLGAGVGAAAGLARKGTFTSAATLQVGQVNPNSPGFYSYVSSAAALATAFSRGVSAEPVLAEVDKRLHIAPAVAAGRLSAEPLPLSPAFRVFATGPSADSAIKLANVAADALIVYETSANDSNPEAESLLTEYHGASLALHRAATNLSTTERAGQDAGTKIAAARATRDTAAARVAALGNAYTAAITSQAPRRGLVSLIAGATSASSNHRSQVELLLFVALLAGLLLGCAVAVAREGRRAWRLKRQL